MKNRPEADSVAEINTALAKLVNADLRQFKFIQVPHFLQENELGIFTTAVRLKAIRAYERGTRKLISEAINRVVAISTVPQVFDLVVDSLTSHMIDIEEVIEGSGSSLLPSNAMATLPEDFARVRGNLIQALDLHRSKFARLQNKVGRKPESPWERIEEFILQQFPISLSSNSVTKSAIKQNIEFWLKQEGLALPSETHLWRKAKEIYNNYYNLSN